MIIRPDAVAGMLSTRGQARPMCDKWFGGWRRREKSAMGFSWSLYATLAALLSSILLQDESTWELEISMKKR